MSQQPATGRAPTHMVASAQPTGHASWERADPPIGFSKCTVDFDRGKPPETGMPLWATMNNWLFERRGLCTNATFERWHAKLTSATGHEIGSDIYMGHYARQFDGATLFLVGDSLCRDQFVDLVCTLNTQQGMNVTIPYNNLGSKATGAKYERFLAEIRVDDAIFWIAFSFFGSMRTDLKYLLTNGQAIFSEISLRRAATGRASAGWVAFHVCRYSAHVQCSYVLRSDMHARACALHTRCPSGSP